MRKFLSLLLTLAMVCSLAVTAGAAEPKEDVVILHTNDVHCGYEAYAFIRAPTCSLMRATTFRAM